jgi:endonuclease I
MKFALIGFVLTFSLFAFSGEPENYYKIDEVSELTSGRLIGRDLVDFVSNVSHRAFNPLGYKRGAKPALFGDIYLERDDEGYFVKDVYCNYKIRNRVGPDRIPSNNVINTEHTWPQSKGSRREPFRGDLHHLFPTDSRANSTRGNYPFGEVEGESVSHDCTASKKGHLINPFTGKTTGRRGYQPPLEHRGNVARAMFYAASFYGYEISDIEEYYLKKWHFEDPVDEAELERNGLIQDAQGNRNPYIDFPELIERIENI